MVGHKSLKAMVLGLKLLCQFFENYVVFILTTLMLKCQDLMLCILKLEAVKM